MITLGDDKTSFKIIFGFYLTQSYLRARYYDAGVGRFISEDPAKDGLNWYVYAGNNPVMRIDPWGLKDVPIRSTVEDLGGHVVYLGEIRSFMIYMGSMGTKVYKIGTLKTKPSDSYASFEPYFRYNGEGSLSVYMDKNDFYKDFSIKDTARAYIPELDSYVSFVLYENNGKYYQRMALGSKELANEKVNYKNFNGPYDLFSGYKRHKITSGLATSEDITWANSHQIEAIQKVIDFLGSEGAAGETANFVMSMLPFLQESIDPPKEILKYGDVRISFHGKSYFIRPSIMDIATVNGAANDYE